MEQATTIHFVRHGEAENPKGIYYGRLPGFPLSERGMRQARAAGEVLRDKPLVAIYSSMLERTRQTAAEIAQWHPHIAVVISDLLIEVHTPYEGRSFAELRAVGGDAYANCAPPYEQPAEVLARMRRFADEICLRHQGAQVAAVTHGDPIAFLVLWARNRPLISAERTRLYQGCLSRGSITTFSFATGNPDARPPVHYLSPPIDPV